MFKRAILRTPSKSMISGLSTANLGTPNYELALVQHKKYIEVEVSEFKKLDGGLSCLSLRY